MNIVSSGGKYMIYDENVNTYKVLPPKTYKCCFNKLSGFYLTEHDDLKSDEKMYGVYAQKVEKVLDTFRDMDRNMGIILSGIKGSGKSMFARLLAKKGAEFGLPLIIVDAPVDGLDDFLSSIKQECIILFDEFEKSFSDDEEEGESDQDKLLSLFDGIDSGKKLYVITCNNTDRLSDCLVSRPGRFHYHFKMQSPSEKEIREYMNDNLNNDVKFNIDDIVMLGGVYNLTYDIMRAIVFELNRGYTLKESVLDLNIDIGGYMVFIPKLICENGITIVGLRPMGMYIGDDSYDSATVRINESESDIPSVLRDKINYIEVSYNPIFLKNSKEGLYFNGDSVRARFDCDFSEPEEVHEALKNIKVTKILLEKAEKTTIMPLL